MNILRWKRKSKNKIKFKTLILFIFSLIMTTFAWFAYSKVLNTTLNIHVASWDMEYYIGSDKQTNPIGISIDALYPTMTEKSVKIDIKNNGEKKVDIEYHVESVTIAGIPFELVQEGQTNETDHYISLTPSVLQTDGTTVKGVITNDLTKFPFTIEVEHSAQVVSGGQGYLTITVNWIGDNDELDSEWGYIVGEYLKDKEPGTPAMTIELNIDSYQSDPTIGTVTPILPSTTETSPYLPTGFTRVPGTTLDTGLVIKDGSGNQYVWIEVPKTSTVYGTTGLNLTNFSDTASIETDLKTYAGTYRNGTSHVDLYPSTNVYRAVGLNIDNYKAIKNQMLQSIYQNGGFYIGRYETGIDGSYRTKATSTVEETPVIKPNTYPFNYITCAQAQTLASGMSSGSNTSSLMFGIQWDLVLKYLETKGSSSSILNSNSTSWGNYNNNIYYITNSKAKYYGTVWNPAPYDKSASSNILLSTGASSIFCRQNISDLAGNLWEWTLEYSSSTDKPSVYRGGGFNKSGSGSRASTRETIAIDNTGIDIGFRVTIF